MRRLATIAFAGTLLAAAALPASSAGAATPRAPRIRVQVVASGLNSPKKLTFHRGRLYVVESGVGGAPGAANCVTGPSIGGPGLTRFCEGQTGSVAVLTPTGPRRLVHLPSVIEADNREVSGPVALAFGRNGPALAVQDILVDAHGRNHLPGRAGRLFGTLVEASGRIVPLARFAAAHPQSKATVGGTPGETTWDSDPYAVAAYRGGFVVADAAANSLVDVPATGHLRLLARFPTLAETVPAGVVGPVAVTVHAQAVPTAVAVGPDGALYVGELRGVPSAPGTAFVYRVVPGHRPTVWASGLTAITAIAFDHRGRLLATELNVGGLLAPATVPGALVRISCDGKTTTTLPVPGLFDPTGVAVGPEGAVYVTNRGTSAGSSATPGQVLRVTGLG